MISQLADFDRWLVENRADFSGEILPAEPLNRHTYYRIGGPAAWMLYPRRVEDLAWLARATRETGIERFTLGAGSNLLVSDAGFPGLVVKMGRFDLGIRHDGSGILETGASVAVSTLLRRLAQEGLAGMEFATGVPGSIGGVVVMNAGTHLGEAKDRCLEVEAWDPAIGDLRVFKGADLQFEYRRNLFLPKSAVVTRVRWQVSSSEPAQVKALIDLTLARRKSTQPVDFPSCGSVFKNPKAHGKHAWQVVDELGLRGHRIGQAQISEKHSNFIVNLGQARADDVRQLIELVKQRALAELGIPMEEEVMSLG
jgi:UDP-N-acetylmuramate dehydrogenase